MDSCGEESSVGPAKLAPETFRCPHCGFQSADKARVDKCRELCEQIRAEKAARPADPQEQETLPTEQEPAEMRAQVLPAAREGELRPRPMRPGIISQVKDAAALSLMPAMDPKFIKWARQGFRVVHEHTHKEDVAKDPSVVILILAR